MLKKTRSLFSHSKHETDVAKYIKEVRDLEAAGVTRRELFKMGLKASATGLVTVTGASLIPGLAQAQNGGAVATNGGNKNYLVVSPPCTKPWSEPLVIPKVCQPVSEFAGLPSGEYPNAPSLSIEKFHSGCGEIGDWERYTDARREPHQRWKELNGESSVKYELECCEIDWNFYCSEEYPTFNSKVWTYKDMTPNANGDYACGPARIKAYYGQPVLMRMFNSLPMQGRDNQGFGINQISPHLHNAHNPPESDGGPNRFFDSAKFYDYWYPNIRAGFAGTHKKSTRYDASTKKYFDCPGDWKETQSSLWFHDHRMDFTAQNVYKGMASFYSLYSNDINLDTDDETTGLRLPSGEYDVPVVIGDKTFDQDGQMFMDLFNSGGFKGDMTCVNFKIKPFFEVKRRKYRFRFLNGGPSTFLELSLKNGKPTIKVPTLMTRIANDGNLLPKAQIVPSVRLGVAERADVIIDFSQYKEGDIVYLENRLQSLAPSQGTTGRILASSAATEILMFKIVGPAVTDDYSAPMKTLQTQEMVPLPIQPKPTVKRSFSFGTSNGAWNVNGKLYSPLVMSAYPAEGSCEEWTFTSGGGWSHPVHIHHEEGQVIKRNGNAPALDDLSRKDVYRIGEGSEGTAGTSSLTFRMQFRDWVGDYPCHCHNVVHEDHGMMFRFKIVPPTDPKAGK